MPRVPLMLRDADTARIVAMQRKLCAESKAAVVRQALDLLEASLERDARIERWKRAAAKVSAESARANREWRSRHPRLDHEP